MPKTASGAFFYTFQVCPISWMSTKARRGPGEIPEGCPLFHHVPALLRTDRATQIRRSSPRLIKRGSLPMAWAVLSSGCSKVFIANTLGALWTIVKANDPAVMSVLTAWVKVIAFTFYIYFDFSGYMDMAIGTAYVRFRNRRTLIFLIFPKASLSSGAGGI